MDKAELMKMVRHHIEVYLSDPEQGHQWHTSGHDVTTLLLLVNGRKSGEPRIIPLIYGRVGRSYVVVASKGGSPENPAWFENLLANPQCRIQVARQKLNAQARLCDASDYDAVWKQMVETFPPYSDYQSRTSRRIPLVMLDPIAVEDSEFTELGA